MAEYGIPYMGSKSSIADKIVSIFPKADHFYDLFGGGFSITHAMLVRRKKDFKYFHFNEIRPGICDLIKDAINGKYSYQNFKPPFVSREEFFKNRKTNAYIKICWSFGNNGKNYIFSKEIEPYKKSMHNAIVFNEFDDLARKVFGFEKFKDGYTIKQKRLFLINKIKFYRKTKIPDFLHKFLNENQLQQSGRLQQLEQLQQLGRLGILQRLQQLERMEQLRRLNFYIGSYDQVKIEQNSIIYCDPPYKGTTKYDGDFDHDKFFDWCDAQENPVFISEYNLTDKRFKKIFEIKKRSMLSPSKDKCVDKLERIYANSAALKKLNESQNAST